MKVTTRTLDFHMLFDELFLRQVFLRVGICLVLKMYRGLPFCVVTTCRFYVSFQDAQWTKLGGHTHFTPRRDTDDDGWADRAPLLNTFVRRHLLCRAIHRENIVKLCSIVFSMNAPKCIAWTKDEHSVSDSVIWNNRCEQLLFCFTHVRNVHAFLKTFIILFLARNEKVGNFPIHCILFWRHDAAAEGGVQEGDVVIYRLLQPQQNRAWGIGALSSRCLSLERREETPMFCWKWYEQ